MVKCRMLAERVQSIQAPRQKSNRSVSGFEATLVGAGAHLLSQDCIALEHGGFAGSLIKGTPLHLILARTREHQMGNGTDNLRLQKTMAARLSSAWTRSWRWLRR